MNCRKAFLSSPFIDTSTLTNLQRLHITSLDITSDKNHVPLEAGGVLAVAQLGLGVLEDLLPGEDRGLVPTQHGANLPGAEGTQLVHGEDRTEALSEGVQLGPDPSHQHPLHHPVDVVLHVPHCHRFVLSSRLQIHTL